VYDICDAVGDVSCLCLCMVENENTKSAIDISVPNCAGRVIVNCMVPSGIAASGQATLAGLMSDVHLLPYLTKCRRRILRFERTKLTLQMQPCVWEKAVDVYIHRWIRAPAASHNCQCHDSGKPIPRVLRFRPFVPPLAFSCSSRIGNCLSYCFIWGACRVWLH
jgi:hypothetical protein